MKRTITLFIITVLCAATLFAQAPEKFSYQAVVRNASNALVTNAQVSVRVSILQGGADGQALYVETHSAVTNANGLLTVEIGDGNVQQGSFADIDWANGPYFLKTETDPNGGSNYSVTSTQQLLSVPYALYAKDAGNVPTVPSDVSVFNNDANYVSNTECADVDLCALAALVSGLQGQLTELQGQLAELRSTIDSLTVPDTTVTPVDTATLPTVITGAVSSITETTATCGGEVIADGGATVTERGVCWSTSATPTVADAHTFNATGLGTFTSSITGLTTSTTYYVRAYATNNVGTAYGETVTFTTSDSVPNPVVNGQPCPNTPTVTDHEGNVYATVQIGEQCWMRDNLRTTTSPSTGTYLILAVGTDFTDYTGFTLTGKQAFWYNNDSATYAPMNYGLLYNWNAAVDTFNTSYGETSVNSSSSNAVSVSFIGHRRGICPAGWHLPSDAEWTQLTNYVSSQSEYTCGGSSSNIAKALASTEGWHSFSVECCPGDQSVTANNATGFSAVPAGWCPDSWFDNASTYTAFWSSTEGGSNYAWSRGLSCDGEVVWRHDYDKYSGFSVRCLRD